jgi:hypothetical protein
MIELTAAHAENLEKIQQNIDIRVYLWKRSAKSLISKTLSGGGTNTMYILLNSYYWLYSFYYYYGDPVENPGPYIIYWSDNPEGVAIGSISDEHWYPLICHDSKGHNHTLSFDYIDDDYGSSTLADKTHILPPLYARYLKMVRTNGVFPGSLDVVEVNIYSEDYFDITGFIKNDIVRTQRMDQRTSHYQKPTAQIILDNSDGYFNKRNTASPYYQYLKSGMRFTIDVKFRGAAWEDPAEWIPLGSFRAKKFSKDDKSKSVTIYGEAGRSLTLQKTTQRIFEQITIRQFTEYFLKDDQMQKPICALVPRKTQVRTAIEEELGIGRFNDVEYEILAKNLCNEETERYSDICADDKGNYIVTMLKDAPVEHDVGPGDAYDRVIGQLKIIINGGANTIITDAIFYFTYSIAGDSIDLYTSITSDGEYLYLNDRLLDYNTTHDPREVHLKKIDPFTGRVIDSELNCLNTVSTDPIYFYGIYYNKTTDKLILIKRVSSTTLRFYEVSKSTLQITGTYTDKTYTDINSSRHIFGGCYDEIFNEWHFLVKDGSAQYEFILDSSYNKIDFVLIDQSVSIVRRGMAIRSNRDFVVCVTEGIDNWIYTYAKRQFWLKGNIQDTNGPLKDTVFFDQPEIYMDHKLDNTGTWDDYVVATDDYWLNVKTGELILKRPLKEGVRLWANYDYHPGINFPEIEDMNRFDAIQQAAETENWRVMIDERENVNLRERIYEEIIPTMDFSEAYNTIVTFESDPETGVPDDIRTSITFGSYVYDYGSGLKFQNVMKHDNLIVSGSPEDGTYLIKQKYEDDKIEIYHIWSSAFYISGSIKRYVITKSPKSVTLGQTYAGKGIGLQNIIHDSNHKTIRVFSLDYLEQLIEGIDYYISYSSGEKKINFVNTEKVQNNPAVIVQYRVQEKLYSIIDNHNIITETEGWNEDTIINKVTVNGQRLLPDITRITVVKQYAVAPYSRQNRSDIPLVQEANSTGQFDWSPDDERTDYSEKDVTKQNFLLEFQHPMVIGTTAYSVIYGDETNVKKKGIIEHTKRDAVYFWEITGTFTSDQYLVILSNRREFRVCTPADYTDMVDPSTGEWLVDSTNDEVGYGNPPTSASDIKTSSHFYIKQMNGAYAREDAKYVVYFEKTVNYYIDEKGRVRTGSITPNESGQGVFTGYPNKAATIIVKPKDSQGATLFDMHGVSGSEGFNSGANYVNIESETFALRINRVQIDSKGVNLKFDNWGEMTQFIEINISGYPLSRLEKISAEVTPTAAEVAQYGERDHEINNLFIGESYQALSLANMIRQFFKDEKSKFNTSIVLAPHLQLEDIVEITNEYEYLENKLMEIIEIVDYIRNNGPSTTDLVLQEVEDNA